MLRRSQPIAAATGTARGSDLAIESVMKQLRGKRLCLFLDIDGTLLEFAAHPDAVYVPPQLVADLRTAYDIFEGAIAFVSGRPVRQIDALFHPLRFSAAGVHGAEIRLSPDGQIMLYQNCEERPNPCCSMSTGAFFQGSV